MGNKNTVECSCIIKYNKNNKFNRTWYLEFNDIYIYFYKYKDNNTKTSAIYCLYELYTVKYNDYIETILLVFNNDTFYIEFYSKESYEDVKNYLLHFVNKNKCIIMMDVLSNKEIDTIKKNINCEDYILNNNDNDNKENDDSDLLTIKKSNNIRTKSNIIGIKLEPINENEEMYFQ
jgi:hypothetical protein